MSSLAGKVALIAGGAGTVGTGIVRALVNRGATVIVPSRSAQSLQQLRATIKGKPDQLFTVEGNIADEKEVENIKKTIVDKFGSIDHLVTSLGSLHNHGPITQLPLEEVRRGMHDLWESHLIVARTFLPLIADKQGSTYTIVTGGLGEVAAFPDTALTSVGAAALFGLSIVLRDQFAKSAVRVNEYRLWLYTVRDDKPDKQPHENSNFVVGEHFVGLLESTDVKGKIVRVNSVEQVKKPFEFRE